MAHTHFSGNVDQGRKGIHPRGHESRVMVRDAIINSVFAITVPISVMLKYTPNWRQAWKPILSG
jgi:hypothetical protein